MRRLVGALLVLIALAACRPDGDLEQGVVTARTRPIRLSGLVRHYEGPLTSVEFACAKGPASPVWLTGISLSVRDASGTEYPSDQLLSSVSVQLLSAERHAQRHQLGQPGETVLFASDGANVTLPEGFGLPLFSNETLVLVAQWKNDEVYRRPQEMILEGTLTFSRRPLESVEVCVAGLGWAWTSGYGTTVSDWVWPTPPAGEVVLVSPLAGPDCLKLELLQGRSIAWPGPVGFRMGGKGWHLRATSRHPDGVARPCSANLILYLSQTEAKR